jgi:hypothetical protein
MDHEAFIYVFDATVMFVAMVTMNWIHPQEVARQLRPCPGGNWRSADVEADREQSTTGGLSMNYIKA